MNMSYIMEYNGHPVKKKLKNNNILIYLFDFSFVRVVLNQGYMVFFLFAALFAGGRCCIIE